MNPEKNFELIKKIELPFGFNNSNDRILHDDYIIVYGHDGISIIDIEKNTFESITFVE